MNSKLNKQIAQIRDVTFKDVMTKRTLWAKTHAARNKFITDLNKTLADLPTKTKAQRKAKSNRYSDEVVAWDKEFGLKGWSEELSQ